jgi:Protein of unknown function (DUF3253)
MPQRTNVSEPGTVPSMSNGDPRLQVRAEEAILDLIADRGPEKTICPSEAARALAGEDDFRPYMEPVREVAAKLARDGRVAVTQKGKQVAIGEARGPIRLGQPQSERVDR